MHVNLEPVLKKVRARIVSNHPSTIFPFANILFCLMWWLGTLLWHTTSFLCTARYAQSSANSGLCSPLHPCSGIETYKFVARPFTEEDKTFCFDHQS